MPPSELPNRPPLLFAPGVKGRSAHEVLHLTGEETRHVRALRLQPGAVVALTDGCGAMWRGRLAGVGARVANCVLDTPIAVPPRLSATLVFGVGNKAHTLWLVEKSTELGAAALCPVEFARSRSVADAARSPAFWSKAERRAVAALKQSGGAWLPSLHRPVGLPEYLQMESSPGRSGDDSRDDQNPRILLDRVGAPLGAEIAAWRGEGMASLAVGPEGGMTRDETTMLRAAGFRPARVAPGILRFETAAIAGLAVLAQHIEAMRAAGPPAQTAPSGAGGAQ